MSSLTHALIYTRVSTEEQRRGGISLDQQLAECSRYCASAPSWVIGGVFTDTMSGKREDRPQYQAMLAKVRELRAEGRSVAVVVIRLDRFGRDVEERAKRWKEFYGLEASLHSVREGGQVHEFTAHILAAVAREEVRRLGERVRGARDHIASLGWRVPTRLPWAYCWRDATPDERAAGSPGRVLAVERDQAPYVVEMFSRAYEGESIRELAAWVMGLSPEARGTVAEGIDAPHARTFSRFAVRRALRSPVYIGRHVRADENPNAAEVVARQRCHWPALVTDEVWLRVQERLDAQLGFDSPRAKHTYLLPGFLRCPGCDGRADGRRPRQPRYACSREYDPCRELVAARTVDHYVLTTIRGVLDRITNDPAIRRALTTEWTRRATPDPLPDDRGVVRRLERTIRDATSLITAANRKLVLDKIPMNVYTDVVSGARAEIESAEAELARRKALKPLAPKLPQMELVLAEIGGWSAAMRGADIAAQRRVMRPLVAAVRTVRLRKGQYDVRIEWTPLGEALQPSQATIEDRSVA